MPEPFPNRTLGFLRRPLLWTVIYGGLAAYGGYALWKIPVEVLPEFNYPQISVTAHDPGATATEMETAIAWPVEGEIMALPNVESVRSTLGNGTVETDIRFAHGPAATDLQAVNGALDRAAAAMPASVHPLAQIMGNAINEVADYTARIPASADPSAVERAAANNLVPALRALPGVQRVELFGAGPEALWVQPRLQALRRYGVSVTAITAALQASVLLQPGGFLTLGHQDVLVEARALPLHAAQIEALPVAAVNGPVPLSALARVVRAPVPIHSAVLLDGQPAVALNIFKQPGASTGPVVQAVQQTLQQQAGLMPAGVSWVNIYNQAHLVRVVGTDLTRNLLLGGLLAIAVMFLVLGRGRGVWVLALTIPLSLLLAIGGLYAAGQSLNLLTLGALTVAVGLLADDGIIVLESIVHRWERADGRWPGIVQGWRDIAVPDIAGTFTTVAVFAPLLFVGGLAGLFFKPFALAMSLALLASLAVSLTLVPLGLGVAGARGGATVTGSGGGLERVRGYNRRLFQAVRRRPRLSLLACFGLLALSAAAAAFVPINFLPLPNEGVLLESFTLPPGSSLTATEAAVQRLTARLRADPAVANVSARIGSASNTAYTEPAFAGEIQIVLKPSIAVNSLDAIGSRALRETQMPGMQMALDTPTVERLGESLSGLPQPFVIQVFGPSIAGLRTLAAQITSRLRKVPALSDVFDNDGYPITEVRLDPNPEALATYHRTAAQLDAQIAPLLNGVVAAQVPNGLVPLDLYVRLASAPALALAALRQLPIRTAGWTPLGRLATLSLVTTPDQFHHLAGARELEILATPQGPLSATIAAARRALRGLTLPPGYRLSFGGLLPELESGAITLAVAALAALALMVLILNLQFGGAAVPGLLLLLIPLALTGGTLALFLSGVGLNAVGLVGFLTLIGIGLNHGIVLLYRARNNERDGMSPAAAVSDAIEVRFRPIALTSLTAVLGMLPTALGWGQGAAPEQGLAIVIMGGIVWSALLSTNLLPALYLHQREKQLACRGRT